MDLSPSSRTRACASSPLSSAANADDDSLFDGGVRVLWRLTQSGPHRSHEERLSAGKENKTPKWNPVLATSWPVWASPRVSARLGRPRRRARSSAVWASSNLASGLGVHFTDLDELNTQAEPGATGSTSGCIVPRVRCRWTGWSRGVGSFTSRRGLGSLWERGTPCQLGWLHFLRRSALRAARPPVAGAVVLVRDRHHELRVYFGGQRLATLTKRPRSQDIVYHPEQFRTVAPASAIKAAQTARTPGDSTRGGASSAVRV